MTDTRISIGKDSLYTITYHVIVKVLDAKAVSDYSEIGYAYNSYYSNASLRFSRTIQLDGSIVRTEKDAVQWKTWQQPGTKSYTDVKVLTFSPSGLETGSTIEFEIIDTQVVPIIPGHWFRILNFHFVHSIVQRIDPVYTARIALEVPKDQVFLQDVVNLDISPAKRTRGDRHIYTWEANHLPALATEDSMPGFWELIPSLHLSSLRTWDAVDEWLSGRFCRESH